MQNLQLRQELDEINIFKFNYEKIIKVGTNLGCLKHNIDGQYKLIKKAIEIVNEGTDLAQVAIVCRVNKLKYPDECYQKITQMRATTCRPRYMDPEYKAYQKKAYERYMFVTNKYKLI